MTYPYDITMVVKSRFLGKSARIRTIVSIHSSFDGSQTLSCEASTDSNSEFAFKQHLVGAPRKTEVPYSAHNSLYPMSMYASCHAHIKDLVHEMVLYGTTDRMLENVKWDNMTWVYIRWLKKACYLTSKGYDKSRN